MQDRLVVLNKVASQSYSGGQGLNHSRLLCLATKVRCITRMLNSAWMKARVRAGLPQVRVHDLKHTFGRRLRAADVGLRGSAGSYWDIRMHVTTHYSHVELINLIQAANKVCDEDNRKLF